MSARTLMGFNQAIGVPVALSADFNAVLAAVARAPVGGQTPLFDATFVNLLLAESQEGRGLLIVLSDGVDTSSRLTADGVLDTASRTSIVGVRRLRMRGCAKRRRSGRGR